MIFTSKRTPTTTATAWSRSAWLTSARATTGSSAQSVRGDGVGITVSYWRDEAAILALETDTEHERPSGGQRTWYSDYHVRVAKVERAYGNLTESSLHDQRQHSP